MKYLIKYIIVAAWFMCAFSSPVIAQNVSYMHKLLTPEGCTVNYRVVKNESDYFIIVSVRSEKLSFLNNPTMKIRTFNDDVICLMTFKGSKGLEFDIVFMVEMNNKDISINFVQDLNSIYVAITRCRDALSIAYDSTIYNKKSLNNLIINSFKENEQYPDICNEIVLK